MSATVADATTFDVPTTDPDAIGQCWDAIVTDGEVFEARAPKTRKGPRRLYGAASGYFDDRDAFVREVERITGADASAVYMTLNPVNPALLARAANRFHDGKPTTTGDVDIVRLAHLLVDADPIRPADISATDDQRDEAVTVRDLVWHYLRDELGWPLPSVITMSGNGGGLLYRINLPNDPEAVTLLQRTLQGLSALFSTERVTIDTTTYNAARITKIVGTVAAKGDHLPAYPWRQATGRFNPNPETVSRDLLASVAAFAPKQEPKASPNGHVAGGRSWEIRDVLRRNGIDFTEKELAYGTSFTLDRCLTSQDHTSGACILEFPNGALSYTCRHNRCQGKRWEDVRGTLGLPTGTSPTITANEKTTGPPNPENPEHTGARSNKPSWPKLDAAALYGLAGEVVDVIDGHTEADKVATLGTFLLMYGNAVGRTPHLMVGNDRHGVNEFLALVGETAKARKGSSQGGPQRMLDYGDQQWARERVQGGLSSGEGLLAAIADPIIRVNKKGEEETIFEGSKDKRLLCIEEELSQLLKVAGRQGNIISEIVRRGWDSRETLRTMTKASPLTVTGPHISIVGHITADELRRELDDTARANGFGNRFLWLCVRRSKAEPFLEPMSERTVTELGRRVQHALIHARKTTRVQFDETARAMWRDVYPDLSDGKPGLVGSLTARAEAHALRLALIYALLDCSNAITGDHLIAALAFMDYAEASARYIFGDATGDPVADRILSALRATGPMSQNDIYELFGRHVSSRRTGLALETLLTARLVRSSQEETGGRPRTVWSATP